MVDSIRFGLFSRADRVRSLLYDLKRLATSNEAYAVATELLQARFGDRWKMLDAEQIVHKRYQILRIWSPSGHPYLATQKIFRRHLLPRRLESCGCRSWIGFVIKMMLLLVITSCCMPALDIVN